MSDTGGKKKRKSRKTKEEKMLEKVTKEQKAAQENKEEQNNEQQRQMPFQATPEQKQLMQNTDINQKMMDMDVRIKYGFIKTIF